MGIAATLLDKARERCSLASDNAMAARYGVSRQVVSKWRAGHQWPNEHHFAALVRDAGADPETAAVALQAEQATEPTLRRAWQRIAEQLGHAAAVALVAVLSHSPALSKTPEGFTAALKNATYQAPSIHYAHWILARASQACRCIARTLRARKSWRMANVSVSMLG